MDDLRPDNHICNQSNAEGCLQQSPSQVDTLINDSQAEKKMTAKKTTAKISCRDKYTRRQWIIFLLFCAVNFCAGLCFSLQSPFYPKLASSKGMTASVYGFVFGIFELVNFIACPIYGANLNKVGAKPMLNVGISVMGTSCIAFGFLDKVPAGNGFVALSFAIRIIEALGQAAYLTAAYATIANEFTTKVSSTFSVLETLYALGMIFGPAIGGLLYEEGGYLVPFATNGCCILIASVAIFLFLPQIENKNNKSTGMLKLLRAPAIHICYYIVFTVAISYGVTNALLEPHLRQFELSPSTNGLLFVINGAAYALSAMPWGFMAEKLVNPRLLCATAGVTGILSFLLMGPAPFIPIKQELWLLILALVLHGIASSGQYVTAFVVSSQEAIIYGFPDNIETYALVAGLWASGLSLGCFVGPSFAGVLYDYAGFSYTTLVVVIMQTLAVILIYVLYLKKTPKQECNQLNEKERISGYLLTTINDQTEC